MVTKYDVFALVHQHQGPATPREIVSTFGKGGSVYNLIHRFLLQLAKEDLLAKTKFGFEVKISPATSLLARLITFCIHNTLNYNLLIEPKLARFLDQTLRQGEATAPSSKLNPRTFKKYVDLLERYGLALIVTRKPLRIKIFYNSLVKNVLLYFGYAPHLKLWSADYISDIEKELHAFKQLRRRNEERYKQRLEEIKIRFIHHSLALEGNPITLPDTIKILKHHFIPADLSDQAVDEVRDYQQAMQRMLKDSAERIPLTLQAMLHFHSLALQHRPDIAGKIRKVEVRIQGNPLFEIAKAADIETRLNRLLKKYYFFLEKKKKSMKELIRFAAYFHNEFQHIHPFVDGNSRTTRLLTLYLLQVEGLPILDLPLGLLDEYMNLTKKSSQRIDKDLYAHLQKIILWNLKMINRELKG